MGKFTRLLVSLAGLYACALMADNSTTVKAQALNSQAELLMNEQDYDAAIEHYQQIMALPTAEAAPQSTYLEIAKSYYLKGDRQAAAANLEKARVALQLGTGIFHCKESANSSDYFIVNEQGELHDTPSASEVAAVLCNYFTLGNYFYPHSFDEFLQMSQRVKAFMQLEKLIDAN